MAETIDPKEGLKAFAATISRQPLGLALHRPEDWAGPADYIANVLEKVRRDGGRVCFGWTFHFRIHPEVGAYLVATHHAVWHAPAGHLIDVTPFQDNAPRPITQHEGVLFQVDDTARPVESDRGAAPLPSRYFALGSTEALRQHVEKLCQEEKDRHSSQGPASPD